MRQQGEQTHSHTMHKDLTTITNFLTAFAPEVSGRSTDTLTPELQQKLTSMAEGKLNEDESRDISRDILANENAMQTLANLLNNNQSNS